MRSAVASISITTLATSHARSGISSPTVRAGATGARRPSAGVCRFAAPLPFDEAEVTAPQLSCDFLRFRFVEDVPTRLTDLREPREESFVERHAALLHLFAFERPDHHVLDALLRDDALRVRRSRVNVLQLGLARRVVNAVRPDVSGVSEECPPPGQVNGVIISR